MFSTDGTGEYEVKPVTKEEHGTVIYIKLKEDEKEFLEKTRVETVVKKYSNHIAYPIMLNFSEEVSEGEGEEQAVFWEEPHNDNDYPLCLFFCQVLNAANGMRLQRISLGLFFSR